jgi:hypothetical protein
MWENTRDPFEKHAISAEALETKLTLASFHLCHPRLAGLEGPKRRHDDVDERREEDGSEQDQVDSSRQSVAVGPEAFAQQVPCPSEQMIDANVFNIAKAAVMGSLIGGLPDVSRFR